jgi:biopolymer transport protein ExbD
MKTGRQKVIGDINITPLTDVFLVLLIIMIVVNPLLQTTGVATSVAGQSQESPDKPADADPGDAEESDVRAITVNIDAAGVYSIGDEVLDNALIKQRILADAATHPDGILLNVDPLAPLERMTDIMDFARSAKIDKISLANTAETGEAETAP